MMLSLDTAYRSFGGEVEASSTPTICRLPDSRRHQLSAIAPAPWGSGAGESMRGWTQLRDFEIASCLIKADQTHNGGKQSHERPSQRRDSGDRAGDNPNAKGNDTYRDQE